MKETVYTVIGFSHGVTKADKKDFTKIALTFVPEFDSYQGEDVQSVFIYDNVNVQIGDQVNLIYGCRRDGKAYVKGVVPAV